MLIKAVVESAGKATIEYEADRESVLACWDEARVEPVYWESMIEESVVVLMCNVIGVCSCSSLSIRCIVLCSGLLFN